MSGPLPDPPELDPTELAGSTFGRARRGFEPTEVRSKLGRAADALRVWTERDAKLTARIEDLSIRLDKAEEFDESRVTELLGVETARIVAAARDAAAEIRGQAASESAELLERSRADAEATSERLISAATAERSEASKILADAQNEAAETTSQANGEAERVLAEVRAEADKLRTDATEEAERTRTEARETAETLTSTAQQRHDEMIEAASKVLDEQTTAAESSAAEIRSRATAELEEARAAAAADLQRAGEEALGIVAAAEADAEARLEGAREQGRAMIEEAKDLRRQMLSDIAERSRAGRQKVEAAKAARAEVLRMIRSVGVQVDGVVDELDDHDSVMRNAADDAAAAVHDDTETVMRELEAQLVEVDLDGLSGGPGAAGSDFERQMALDAGLPDAMSVGSGTADSGTAGSGTGDDGIAHAGVDAGVDEFDPEASADEELRPDLDGAEGTQTVGDGASGDDELDDDLGGDDVVDDDLEDDDLSDDDLSGDEVDESQMASVHDLFEKLRSEDRAVGGDVSGPQPHDDEVSVVPAESPGARVRDPQTGSAGVTIAAAPVSTLTEARRSGSSGDTGTRVDAEDEVGLIPDTDRGAGTNQPVEAGRSADAQSAGAGAEGAGPPAEGEGAGPPAEGEGAGPPAEGDGSAVTTVDDPDPEESDGSSTYSSVLDRRDESLEPAEKLLTRTLKRLFSDEQNEVFDRVRRHKRSRIEVSDLLGDSDDTSLFVSKLTESYLMAAHAGAIVWGELSGDDPDEPAESDVVGALTSQVDELLALRRAHLRESLEAHAEVGGDTGELVDRLRSAYRELRATSVEEQAGDLATGGFAIGAKVAAGPDSTWCWVPDNGGLPCADAEDNALAGALACGSEFPTGDVVPPAHPGCRCIVIPEGVLSAEP